MRYPKEHKDTTRSKILSAALTKFRSDGYHGIGVDGISKEAGVTSGAFYKSFSSKSAAFKEVVAEGFSVLREALVAKKATGKSDWLVSFFQWYLSTPKSTDDEASCLPMEGGCALPTLSPEVARTDESTKETYQKEILKIVDLIAADAPGNTNKQKRSLSLVILCLLVGSVIISRSVKDQSIKLEISKSSSDLIKKLLTK